MTNDEHDGSEIEMTPDQARDYLSPLRCIDEPIAPPAGLADRTLAFVRRESAQRNQAVALAATSRRNGTWSTRLDVAVAASLLILMSALGFGGIARLRHAHAQQTCTNNLRQLYTDLGTYASLHDGHFPDLGDRRLPAKAFVDILMRDGFLTSKSVVSCPAVAHADSAPATQVDYAYSLGSRGADGQIRGPTNNDDANTTPLLADRPLANWVPRGSTGNHRGGANVLFVNGAVRFCTAPTVGWNGDHVFLNEARQVAAGLHQKDAVLGVQDDRP